MDSETITCPQCGSPVAASALLCPKCGRPNISTAFAGTYSSTQEGAATPPVSVEPAPPEPVEGESEQAPADGIPLVPVPAPAPAPPAETIVAAEEPEPRPQSELPASLRPSIPFVATVSPAPTGEAAPDSSPDALDKALSNLPPPVQPDRMVGGELPMAVRHIPDPHFGTARHPKHPAQPTHSQQWYGQQAQPAYKPSLLAQRNTLYTGLLIVMGLATVTLCASILDARCLFLLVFLAPLGIMFGSGLYRRR